MKVICINAKGFVDTRLPPLEEGRQYTPIDETLDPNGLPYYELLEIPQGYARNWYAKNRFIPLSDIDETEFIREYNTEKV